MTCYFSVLEWILDEQVSCALLRRNNVDTQKSHWVIYVTFVSP